MPSILLGMSILEIWKESTERGKKGGDWRETLKGRRSDERKKEQRIFRKKD